MVGERSFWREGRLMGGEESREVRLWVLMRIELVGFMRILGVNVIYLDLILELKARVYDEWDMGREQSYGCSLISQEEF